MYQFDEDDLPYVFSYSLVRSDWGLWRAFCSAYWDNAELKGREVVGIPEGFPPLKYVDVTLYYAITESMDLKGPFLDREEAIKSTRS